MTLPNVKQGSWSLLGARLSGSEGVPTGSITVSTGGQQIGTGKIDKRGYVVALIDTRRLAVGQHTLTAVYPGDTVYGPTQRDVKITVKKKDRR